MSGIIPGGSTRLLAPLRPLLRSLRRSRVPQYSDLLYPSETFQRRSRKSRRESSWGSYRSSGRSQFVQRIGAALVVYAVLFSGALAQASEDPNGYPRQREAFVGSICDQDWQQALHYLDTMLELEETPELYRKALQVYRPRLALYLTDDVELLHIPGCERVPLPSAAAKEIPHYALPIRR